MIEYIDNRTYLILAVIVYAAVIICASKLLGIFKNIAALKQAKEINLKITSSALFKKINNFNSGKVKPVCSYTLNNIFLPAIFFSGNALHSASLYLINISQTTEKFVSENSREGFELVSVFSRRLVYAKSGSIWTAFLAFLVLFYFILTNL